MAVLVMFTACRMTELTRMKRSDIIFDEKGMNIKTKTKKGKKEIDHDIRLERKDGICCPVKAMESWLKCE
jgi:integrase